MISNQVPSTFGLLGKIWFHLSLRRRLQLFLLLLVMLASGLAELVSLGAVLPFLAVLTNPEQLWQQQWIQLLAIRMGVSQANQLVFPLALAFALTALLAATVRLLNLWLSGRLAAAIGSDLACEAYRLTLYQPYQVHVQRNSSKLISTLTRHTSCTLFALNTVLLIISAVIVSAGLLIGLLVLDWQVALSTLGLFGIAYLLIAITTRSQLLQNGKRIASASDRRVQSLQEGSGAIRDVLLNGIQHTFLEFYERADRTQRQLESRNRFLSSFPRYALLCT